MSTPYERPNIQRLDPYVPGEQPRTSDVLKLNTNENPYPPSPNVMQAITQVSAEALRKYPPPDSAPFRDAAAKLHNLNADQIIATNGGDELLRLLITVFTTPATPPTPHNTDPTTTGGIGITAPTYSLYPILAEIHDTPIVEIPRDDNFDLPADYAAKLNAADCRLAFIVNPHAPTGKLASLDQLRQIASDFNGVLVIDEAYINFAPAHAEAIPLIDSSNPNNPDNIIILRSLSKGYSLAGLRFGYGLGPAPLITALQKARDSYNLDILAQAAAVAAIEDQTYAQGTWQKVIDERARITAELRERQWQVIDSSSNFILATPPKSSPDAQTIFQSLKDRGLFVRYFNQPRLTDKLRITIGTPEQNNRLIELIDTVQ